MRVTAGLAEDARRPPAAFAGSLAAMLARGAEPPGTPAIGGGGRVSGFGVDAGSARFAGSPSAVLARKDDCLEPPSSRNSS
jgi:hypothetical protein